MELFKIKIRKPGVTLAGADLEVGDEIEISRHSAASLVSDGLAEDIDGVLNNVVSNEEGQGDKLPGSGTGGAGKTIAEDPTAAEKALTKAIDAKYKADPLKEAAKSIGVEFAYDATKPAVIAAIIAAGKSEVILALEVPAV